MIAPVAETVGEIPSRSKYGWLRGSLMRAITLLDAVLLAGELADDDVVLVVAGRRDEQVGRALDAGALEHEQLGRVAAEHLVLELGLELVEAVRPLLDQRHLVAGAEQRPREVRADLAAACDQDVHQAGTCLRRRGRRSTSVSIALEVGQTILRPRDGVELRARRVEHADDDRRHLEVLLRGLRDHEVRVVAVGRDDDGVGLLDPRLAEQLEVHAVPDDEVAGPVLAESPERVLVLVDHGHVPARAVQLRARRPSRRGRSR